MCDIYKKNKGNAGLGGVQFQLDLLIISFLNAFRNLKNWRISTEDKEAGKFDDIVIKLSEEAAILIQAKCKAKKNVTKEQLLSTNCKNCDFSLPKYFFSHLKDIKENFREKTIIICTDTNINGKGLQNCLTHHSVDSDHVLYYEGGNQSFCTFNDNILADLKASAEVYLDKNLQGRGIDKAVITDENVKDFLRNLQIFPNYPSGNELNKIIEQLLSLLSDLILYRTMSYHEIYRKVEEWFKQPKGEYLTETRAKAMFCEIKSDKYCESLKDYCVSFENHFDLTDSSTVFHVTGKGGYLMRVLKIYRSLQDGKSRKLYVNPDDDAEVQKQVIEAFELQRYTFLIIVWSSFMEQSMRGKLKDILEKYRYKKVVLIADSDATLTGLGDVSQVDGSVTFADLSKDYREMLLKNKNVVFQGEAISLENLLHVQSTEDYARSLNSTMLEKLIRGERIKVGTLPLNPEEDTIPYYISRTLEHNINRPGRRKYPFSEENIYEVKEKLILISDSAGMGKSTFLTRLALTAKRKMPHLWIIKIILNDYTRILRDTLRKNKQSLDLIELLNSHEATKLTNDFERLVFSINGKVLLMVDGVDEISPDYTALVINLLLHCQKSANFAKILVTTRPHLTQDLEQRLKVESIRLLPFTGNNQIDFLVSYWMHNLQLGETDKVKCEQYGRALITKMFPWIKSHYYAGNLFTAIPLQVRILAEIFQQNVRSKELADWEGCREYLEGNESEPKLPERVNIARLYDMFIEKKQDVFVDKGNPGGNTAANRALIDQFEECLAYHRSLALDEILHQSKRDFFSCRRLDCEDMKEYILKIGIVQRFDDEFQFIHRTFAEYFVADSIIKELQLQNQNHEFQRLLIDEVLMMSEFEVTRAFIDSFLQKVVDSLPSNIFESYQSSVSHPHTIENIVFLLAGEGFVAILQLVLKSVQFEIVTGKEVNLRDLQSKYPGNTLSELQALVREAGVNIKDEKYGITPLFCAVKGNHLEMISFLAQQGANLNCTDNSGYTVLHTAVYHLDTVKLLVELGVDVNIVNKQGYTAVLLAAASNKWTVVKYLVESGADINLRNGHDRSVLHYAAKWGPLDVTECLVAHGADINVRDNDGHTALHVAASVGNWVNFESLAECGMDFDIDDGSGRTMLHLATEMGQLKVVKFLVKWGMDINFKNKEGNTALHVATLNSELETAKYLVEQGADMNLRGSEGRTALHLAVLVGTLDTTKYLVERGVDLNVRDNVGNTALHLAAFRGRLETVKYLVECGLDVNVTDRYGSTVLHLAAFNGNLENIEYLVECGVPVNARDKNGSTALHLAAFNGRLDNIKYLVEHGADLGIKDNEGQTALALASMNGHLESVLYLEEVGLSVST